MRRTKDIETVLYEVLANAGYSASAHGLPADLGKKLPHIHVTRTGGYERDLVLEGHNVDFDVYAEDMADAMDEACLLCGIIRELADDPGVPCYVSHILTLPYNNMDPRHQDLGRVTFKTELLTRTE